MKLRSQDNRVVVIGVILVALLHSTIWFAHYNQTALGESPALDNRQTLELARAMAEGTLAEEPFHRAPLYPYLLSLFLKLGLPFDLLPLIARWLNALSLAVIAGATSWIALRLWGRASCGWLAGLLVALNPVLVFFAGDAFDILPAAALLLPALALFQGWLHHPSLRRSLGIAALLALGAALRSHLLPLALIWIVGATYLSGRHRLGHAVLAALPVAASILLLGWVNVGVSGQFRLMPWQGAYNLWAGNGPDANGRIYAQNVRVDFGNRYDNPAKLESIALYEQETGSTPPHSIDAMNDYWKEKTFSYIAEHPLDWLGLMCRKAYYFLNSYEQYDNKTYGFHKQRHPLLNWNPIHWGFLLTLAVGGALIALKDPKKRPFVVGCILCFAAYAAGTILFYTSNRFRLPMIPILAFLAPGCILFPVWWRQASKLSKGFLVVCIASTLVLSYSGFFGARDTATWEEDYALLANASLRTGRESDAIHYAKDALAMDPSRPDMYAVLAQAEFNEWALSQDPAPLLGEKATELLALTRKGAIAEKHLAALIGIYEWKLGQKDQAVRTWRTVSDHDALARLCLFWTEKEDLSTDSNLKPYQGHPSQALLEAAAELEPTRQDGHPISRFLNHLLAPAGKRANETAQENQ